MLLRKSQGAVLSCSFAILQFSASMVRMTRVVSLRSTVRLILFGVLHDDHTGSFLDQRFGSSQYDPHELNRAISCSGRTIDMLNLGYRS